MKKFWIFYCVLPIFLLTLLFAGGFAPHTAAAPGQFESTEATLFDVDIETPDPNETLRLVNQERELQNLEILNPDPKLALVAKTRAADMVKRQYYAHKNPDGNYYYDYFKDFDLITGYSCENLDLVFVPDQTKVVDEWMASLKGHKGCMMHQHTTKAGYATVKLTLVNFDGSETTAYLIVAIHAEIL